MNTGSPCCGLIPVIVGDTIMCSPHPPGKGVECSCKNRFLLRVHTFIFLLSPLLRRLFMVQQICQAFLSKDNNRAKQYPSWEVSWFVQKTGSYFQIKWETGLLQTLGCFTTLNLNQTLVHGVLSASSCSLSKFIIRTEKIYCRIITNVMQLGLRVA